MLGRLKFDLTELANEMLDNIPEEYFSSSTTTFLDPAMAGGQFIKAVVDRLRKYGHTDENITSRVYGYETNKMRVNFAAKQCNNVGTLVAKDFLGEDMSKKFDVVIGNPPYDGIYKGLGSPWPKFSAKAIELTKENGYVAFITPLSWMSPSSELFDLFKTYELQRADITVGKYFKNVGSTFSFWCLKKTINKTNNTCFINEYNTMDINLNNFEFLPNVQNNIVFSIIEKVLFNNDHLDVNISSELHTQNTKFKFSDELTLENIFPARHTNTNTKYFSTKSENFDVPKITFCVTGNFEPRFDDGNLGTCQNTMWIPCTEEESINIIAYLKSSKIMNFIFKVCKWSGANNRNLLRILPTLPNFGKTWTNKELYTYFNLTQEEIDYIEANVK